MAEAIRVRIVITNRKALRAIRCVLKTMEDVAEDMPWRDDVAKAARAAEYLASHVTVVDENLLDE